MHPTSRYPANALPQLYADALHLAGAIVVTLCTTFLAYTKTIPADVTGAVLTGVVGYIAGHANTIARTLNQRIDDTETSDIVSGQ